MSAFIQGGPAPIMASSAEAAAAFRIAENKEPAVKEVKASSQHTEISRYAQRKTEGKTSMRGQNVDIEA